MRRNTVGCSRTQRLVYVFLLIISINNNNNDSSNNNTRQYAEAMEMLACGGSVDGAVAHAQIMTESS